MAISRLIVLRNWLRRRRFKNGRQLTRFLVPDIRRDVEVVDASEVESGFVTAKVRTWNVLYVSRGFATVPEYGPPRRLAIEDLWHWDGASWGGPVPDDDPGKT
jgi:hypothetical protein